MKRYYHAVLFLWAFGLARAFAAQVDFEFSGRVTFSRDDAGWFPGALPQGSTFNGRIRYDTNLGSGDATNPDDPSVAQYQFHPNPINPPLMSLGDINGHLFNSATEFFINTYDNYGVNPPLPGIVPFDEHYYTTYGNFNFDGGGLSMEHYFAEFGIHFNSTVLTSTTSDALPTAAPNLAAFALSYFDIYVFASGVDAPLAVYHGDITNVTPVPEPAMATLVLAGAGLLFLKRKLSNQPK